MRIVERSPDQRQLQTLFLPQEPRRVIPDEVAEEIILTHPVQPPTSSFLERIFRETFTGTAGVDTLDLPNPPAEGHYFYVFALGAFHSEAATRAVTILIGSAALGFTELLPTTSVGASTSLAMQRAFLLPPGLNIRMSTPGLLSPGQNTLRITFIDYLLPEVHPAI